MNGHTASHDPLTKITAAGTPHTQALETVKGHLRTRNPYTAAPDPRLWDAANLYTALVPDREVTGWLLYTYRTGLELAPEDPRTRQAADRLVQHLRRTSTTPQQVRLRPLLSPVAEPIRRVVLAARFAVAELLHTAGLCEIASLELHAALAQWTPQQARDPGYVTWYLVDAVRLLDLCDRADDAIALIEHYRTWLPPTGTAQHETMAGYATTMIGDVAAFQRHRDICTQRLPPQPGTATTAASGRDAVYECLSQQPTTPDAVSERQAINERPRWTDPATLNHIVHRYTVLGESLRQVAEQVGCSKDTVSRVLAAPRFRSAHQEGR